ncbi:hypothetical protein NYG88_03840 [Campylobacter felis]|uniref:hypothetical protein n=1 Tax=Campylobacter felis TaxID=2974565 RepID=UPI00256BB253|nr:hypothetical protein [Campylobacter felis]
MEEFLIPVQESENEELKALKRQNEALQNELLQNEALQNEAKSPFNNAYEQYLMKKYYGDEGLKVKQDINFKSRSINEPIKQLARINKALKASDEALKSVDEAGLRYGANKKLNNLTGGIWGIGEENAKLDNALANFANMSGQVTSRGGNNSNKSADEQQRLLGRDFASTKERVSRIAQTRKNIMDYFEQEKAGLEALGYRLDENSSFMREYLEQKKKQEYLEKNANSFDFNAYEKSVYEDFAKQKEQNDGLLRLKKP